ncbi:MAG: hypothetical protein J6J25_04500 [Bacteroidales bacterium]|nr:hypothetical protein [Bacteroidales bacterium]
MIRTIDRYRSEALARACHYFTAECKSIQQKSSIPGSHKSVASIDTYHGRKFMKMMKQGTMPRNLGGFIIIGADGTPVAICHYYKTQHSSPDPEPYKATEE